MHIAEEDKTKCTMLRKRRSFLARGGSVWTNFSIFWKTNFTFRQKLNFEIEALNQLVDNIEFVVSQFGGSNCLMRVWLMKLVSTTGRKWKLFSPTIIISLTTTTTMQNSTRMTDRNVLTFFSRTFFAQLKVYKCSSICVSSFHALMPQEIMHVFSLINNFERMITRVT